MELALGFTLDSALGQKSAPRQRWAQVMHVMRHVEERVRWIVLRGQNIIETLRSTAQLHKPADMLFSTTPPSISRCPHHYNKAIRRMGSS